MITESLFRMYRCAKRMARVPAIMLKDVAEGYYQDGVNVRRSAVPATIVGGATAAITLPLHKLVVPAALVGRLAKTRKPPKEAAIAAVMGGMAGLCLVTYIAQIAIALYVFEIMILAAKADREAQLFYEQDQLKRKAKRTPSRETLGSLNGYHP